MSGAGAFEQPKSVTDATGAHQHTSFPGAAAGTDPFHTFQRLLRQHERAIQHRNQAYAMQQGQPARRTVLTHRPANGKNRVEEPEQRLASPPLPLPPHQQQFDALRRKQHLQQQQQDAPPSPKAQMQCTTELSENKDWIRLMIDLPGVQAKDLNVNIDHGVLSVSGSRKTLSVDGAMCIKKYKFSRRYAIDTDVVDIAQATAHLSNGVLTFLAPKTNRPRRVQIPVTEDEDEEDSGSASNSSDNEQPHRGTHRRQQQLNIASTTIAGPPPRQTPTPIEESPSNEHEEAQHDKGGGNNKKRRVRFNDEQRNGQS